MHSLAHTKMLAIAIAAWRMNVATPDVAVHNERMRIAIVDESAGRAAVNGRMSNGFDMVNVRRWTPYAST